MGLKELNRVRVSNALEVNRIYNFPLKPFPRHLIDRVNFQILLPSSPRWLCNQNNKGPSEWAYSKTLSYT